MAKVVIEFDSVEEQEDIQTALNGYKWKLAMWDLDQELRKTTKYDVSILGNDEPRDYEYDMAEKMRETIREILNSHGLIMD